MRGKFEILRKIRCDYTEKIAYIINIQNLKYKKISDDVWAQLDKSFEN